MSREKEFNPSKKVRVLMANPNEWNDFNLLSYNDNGVVLEDMETQIFVPYTNILIISKDK